jgi:hypothetical protein
MFVWISYDCPSHAFTNDGVRCPPGLTQVNVMDIRKNKALRIVGEILLVSLALATIYGGWIVIWAG